jgi:hypothetical protein
VAQPVAQIPEGKSVKEISLNHSLLSSSSRPAKQQRNTAKQANQSRIPYRPSCSAYRWPQGCSTGPTAAPATQHRVKVHLQHSSAAQGCRKGYSTRSLEKGKSPAKANGIEYIQTQLPSILPSLPQTG